MRRALLILALIGAALYGGAVVSAPWFAFRALRAAAQAGDIRAMAELIDFDAVRKSLQDQVDPQAAVPPPDFWHDPFGSVQHAFTAPMKPAQNMDAYLTPQSLVTLTAGGPPPAPGKANIFTDLFPGHGRTIRYWDVKRCRIAVLQPSGRTSLFTFERRGTFDWKLVQIKLDESKP